MRGFSRGPIYEAPVSQAATWSWRLGWFAFVVALLSVIIVRTGFLEIAPALGTFAAALMFAALAILLAFAAFVVIWRQGTRGLGRAVGGMLLGILLLAYPPISATARTSCRRSTTSPPTRRTRRASASSRACVRAAPASIPARAWRRCSSRPIPTSSRCNTTTRRRRSPIRWRSTSSPSANGTSSTRKPPAPARPGEIEAVARTLIMGFRDDVVVRVSQVGPGSRIDVRSASRYGTHDFGANARRVASLLSDIDDAMDDAMSKPAAAEPKEQDEKPARKRPAPKKTERPKTPVSRQRPEG